VNVENVFGHGEFRTTDEPKETRLSLEGRGVQVEVQYSVIGGLGVFEGDIVLGPADVLDAASLAPMGIGISGAKYRWPEAVIPYRIHSSLADPHRVDKAVHHWRDRTRLEFVEVTTANATRFKDHIVFRDGTGCSSRVGRQGRTQPITLSPRCTVGSVIHEIGHAVGLWHEQSREDRDRFVRILLQNVKKGHEHNFHQHVVDGDDIGDYDYVSIMHYPRTAFSVNGEPTIEPADPDADIGQREGLSDGDVAAVHALYP
jgi:hypothetical protein